MSKNFITLLFTSRLPNRSPLCFQIVWVKRGYYRIRTDFYAPPHILVLKVSSFRFQIPSLFHLAIFRFLTIHFPINCMNVCVVIFNRVLFCSSYSLFFRYLKYFFWWRIRESNPWPSACKADALANWANPPVFSFQCSVSVFSFTLYCDCLLPTGL